MVLYARSSSFLCLWNLLYSEHRGNVKLNSKCSKYKGNVYRITTIFKIEKCIITSITASPTEQAELLVIMCALLLKLILFFHF